MFGVILLVDDNGVTGMYYQKSDSWQATEIYVEVEDIFDCGHNHSQTLEIRSENPVTLFDTAQLLQNQFTQLETVNDLPPWRGRKTGNIRYRDIDRSSSSSCPTMHKLTVEVHGTNIPISSVLEPLPYTDVDLVDVELDLEPEPDVDDFGSDDNQDDAYLNDSIQIQYPMTFSESWLGSEGLTSR